MLTWLLLDLLIYMTSQGVYNYFHFMCVLLNPRDFQSFPQSHIDRAKARLLSHIDNMLIMNTVVSDLPCSWTRKIGYKMLEKFRIRYGSWKVRESFMEKVALSWIYIDKTEMWPGDELGSLKGLHKELVMGRSYVWGAVSYPKWTQQ